MTPRCTLAPIIRFFYIHMSVSLLQSLELSKAFYVAFASLNFSELPLFSRLFIFSFFSGLCRGKAMVAYTNPQHRKKEESKQLRGERDKIKFIYIRFKRWQVVGLRKARRRQDVP